MPDRWKCLSRSENVVNKRTNDLHQALTPIRAYETQERAVHKLELEVLKGIGTLAVPHNLERMNLHNLKGSEGMTPHNLETPERILSLKLEVPARIVPHTLIQWTPNGSRPLLDRPRRNQIPINVLDIIPMSCHAFSWYC